MLLSDNKRQGSSLCSSLRPTVTLLLLVADYPIITQLEHAESSSVMAGNQVPHPNQKFEIMLLYILILTFTDRRRDTHHSELCSSIYSLNITQVVCFISNLLIGFYKMNVGVEDYPRSV
jgi:hypothetical protein